MTGAYKNWQAAGESLDAAASYMEAASEQDGQQMIGVMTYEILGPITRWGARDSDGQFHSGWSLTSMRACRKAGKLAHEPLPGDESED